eukprot:gene9585-14877_t
MGLDTDVRWLERASVLDPFGSHLHVAAVASRLPVRAALLRTSSISIDATTPHGDLLINENRVIKPATGWVTVHAVEPITSGVHEWSIKIENQGETSDGSGLMLGIVPKGFCRYDSFISQGSGWCLSRAGKFYGQWKRVEGVGTTAAFVFGTGDTVKFELDTEASKMTVSVADRFVVGEISKLTPEVYPAASLHYRQQHLVFESRRLKQRQSSEAGWFHRSLGYGVDVMFNLTREHLEARVDQLLANGLEISSDVCGPTKWEMFYLLREDVVEGMCTGVGKLLASPEQLVTQYGTDDSQRNHRLSAQGSDVDQVLSVCGIELCLSLVSALSAGNPALSDSVFDTISSQRCRELSGERTSEKWTVHSITSDEDCVYLATAEGLLKIGSGRGRLPTEIAARNDRDFPGHPVSLALVAGILYVRPSAAHTLAMGLPFGHDLIVCDPSTLEVVGHISADGSGSIPTEDNRYTALALAASSAWQAHPTVVAESMTDQNGLNQTVSSTSQTTILSESRDSVIGSPGLLPNPAMASPASQLVGSSKKGIESPFDPKKNLAAVRTVVLTGPKPSVLTAAAAKRGKRSVLHLCKDACIDASPVSEKLSSSVGHLTVEMWMRSETADESKNVYVHGDKSSGGEVFIDMHSLDNGWYVKGGARVEVRNGSLAEVRVWKIARPPIMISRDMSTPLTGNESGLVAYWPMHEGQGRLIYDWASNHPRHNGWIANRPHPSWRQAVDFPMEPPASLPEPEGCELSPWQLFLPSVEQCGMCANGRQLAVMVPEVEDVGAGQKCGLALFFSLEDGAQLPRNHTVAPPVDGLCHFDSSYNGVWYVSMAGQVLCWSQSECAVPPPLRTDWNSSSEALLSPLECAARLADAMDDRACQNMDHAWPCLYRALCIDPSLELFQLLRHVLQAQFKRVQTARRASIFDDPHNSRIALAVLRLLRANFRVARCNGLDPKSLDLSVVRGAKNEGHHLYQQLITLTDMPKGPVTEEAVLALREGLPLFFTPEALRDMQRELLASGTSSTGAHAATAVLEAVCSHMAGFKQSLDLMISLQGDPAQLSAFLLLLMRAAANEMRCNLESRWQSKCARKLSMHADETGHDANERERSPITAVLIGLQAAILGSGNAELICLLLEHHSCLLEEICRAIAEFRSTQQQNAQEAPPDDFYLELLRSSASGQSVGSLVIAVPITARDCFASLPHLKKLASLLEDLGRCFPSVQAVESNWSANWTPASSGSEAAGLPSMETEDIGGTVSSWIYCVRLTIERVAASVAGNMVKGLQIPDSEKDPEVLKWIESPLFAGGLRDSSADIRPRLCDEIAANVGQGKITWDAVKSNGTHPKGAVEIDSSLRHIFAVLVREDQREIVDPRSARNRRLSTELAGKSWNTGEQKDADEELDNKGIVKKAEETECVTDEGRDASSIPPGLHARFRRVEALKGWLMHVRHDSAPPPTALASASSTASKRSSRCITAYSKPNHGSWKSIFHSWRALKKLQRLLGLNAQTDTQADSFLELLLSFLTAPEVNFARIEKAVREREEKGRLRAEGLRYLTAAVTNKAKPIKLEALAVVAETMSRFHYADGLKAAGPFVVRCVQESVYALLHVVLAPLASSTPPNDSISQVQCNLILKLFHCRWDSVDFAYLRSMDLPKTLFSLVALWNPDGTEKLQQPASNLWCKPQKLQAKGSPGCLGDPRPRTLAEASVEVASGLFSACALKSALSLARYGHPGATKASLSFLSQVLECIARDLKLSVQVLKSNAEQDRAKRHEDHVAGLLAITARVLQALADATLENSVLGDLLPLLASCVFLPAKYVSLAQCAMACVRYLLPHFSTERAEQGLAQLLSSNLIVALNVLCDPATGLVPGVSAEHQVKGTKIKTPVIVVSAGSSQAVVVGSDLGLSSDEMKVDPNALRVPEPAVTEVDPSIFAALLAAVIKILQSLNPKTEFCGFPRAIAHAVPSSHVISKMLRCLARHMENPLCAKLVLSEPNLLHRLAHLAQGRLLDVGDQASLEEKSLYLHQILETRDVSQFTGEIHVPRMQSPPCGKARPGTKPSSETAPEAARRQAAEELCQILRGFGPDLCMRALDIVGDDKDKAAAVLMDSADEIAAASAQSGRSLPENSSITAAPEEDGGSGNNESKQVDDEVLLGPGLAESASELHPCCLSLLELPPDTYFFETPSHPFVASELILQTIDIPGSSSYKISFDPRCKALDYLHLYTDRSQKSELFLAADFAEQLWSNGPAESGQTPDGPDDERGDEGFYNSKATMDDAARRCYVSPTLRPCLKASGAFRCATDTAIRGRSLLYSEGQWVTVQATSGVVLGKYYYEARMLSPDPVYVGYACEVIDTPCGECSASWSYCGNRGYKWHGGDRSLYPSDGVKWKGRDVVGVLLDLFTREIEYTLNGKRLGVAFSGLPAAFYFPTVTVGSSAVELNLGDSPFSFAPPPGYLPYSGFYGHDRVPGGSLPVEMFGTYLQTCTALLSDKPVPLF